MADDFLPKGYEAPKQPSKYLKFEDGETRFRVLSSAITGWEYWTEADGKRTPIRVRTEDELPEDVKMTQDRQKQPKHFWAFVVLNKGTNEIQILELTQQTLMKAIQGLVQSKAWGSPKDYDIVVTKTKTGSQPRDVKYSVMPEPKTALDEGVKSLYEALDVKLENLFAGEDPFGSQA